MCGFRYDLIVQNNSFKEHEGRHMYTLIVIRFDTRKHVILRQ